MNEPPRLRLHVPEPTGRPDRDTDFSYLRLSPAGAMRRPEIDTAPEATFDLINGTIRVLDDDGMGTALGRVADHRAVGDGEVHFLSVRQAAQDGCRYLAS